MEGSLFALVKYVTTNAIYFVIVRGRYSPPSQ